MYDFKDIEYLGYDSGKNVLINKLGDISRVVRVSFPEMFQNGEAYYSEIAKNLKKSISSMETLEIYDISVHQINFTKNEFASYEIGEKDTFFELEKKKHHSRTPQLKVETYFCLEIKQPTFKLRGLVYSLLNKNVKLYKTNSFNKQLLALLNKNYELLLSGLRSTSKIKIREIKDLHSIESLLYGKYFNLNIYEEDDRKNTENEYIEHVEKKHVEIGNKIVKNYNVINNGFDCLPFINPYNENQYYGDLPISIISDFFIIKKIDSISHTIIYKEPRDKLVKRFFEKDKLQRLTNTNKKYVEINSEMIKDQEIDIVSLHFGITILGKKTSLESFFKNCETIEKIFNNYNFLLSENYKNNINQFYYYSFGNTHNIPYYDRCFMPLKEAVKFYLYEGTGERYKKRGIWLKKIHSNSDFFLDIESQSTTNKNGLLIGASGTGKSVTLGYILEALYNEGAIIYLSDIGFSQKNLCEKLGGVYIELSADNPIRLNPFASLNIENISTKEQEIQIGQDIDYLTNLLHTCWKRGEENIRVEEEKVINDLLKEYLKSSKTKNKNFNDFYFFSQKLFEKAGVFKTIPEYHFDKRSFFLVMANFLKEEKERSIEKGKYHYLFDEDQKIANEMERNRFVVFELEKIKDDKTLFFISSYLIDSLINKKMLSTASVQKRMIYAIDEAHMMLDNPTGIKKIAYLYRTLRKHNASIFIATQEIEDVLKNEAILNNSSIKILKKQPEKYKDKIEKVFSLDKSSLNKLYSITEENKKKSIFIQFDQEEGNIYNILIDPTNLLMAETNKKIREKLNKEKEKTNNLVSAVKNYQNKN